VSPPARNWRPVADSNALRLRAELLAKTRAFFAAREVLEVETPALSAAAITDPHLFSFAAPYSGPGLRHGRTLYLHTSPEFPMKRLLAAGSGCIYQIARVFRNGEAGRRHNPEFTLLEWYRVGFDHHRLMTEVAELATMLLAGRLPLAAAERLSYREIFQHHLRLDPHRASVTELAASVSSCISTALNWRTVFTNWATPTSSAVALRRKMWRGRSKACRPCRLTRTCWLHWNRACPIAPEWRWVLIGW